jgi:hypothetical protein
VMVPARIVAFATMRHQSWATRPHEPPARGARERPAEAPVQLATVRLGSAAFAIAPPQGGQAPR